MPSPRRWALLSIWLTEYWPSIGGRSLTLALLLSDLCLHQAYGETMPLSLLHWSNVCRYSDTGVSNVCRYRFPSALKAPTLVTLLVQSGYTANSSFSFLFSSSLL